MTTTLFSTPMLVLDTETTGFPDAPWSRVVEFAAVMVGCDGSIGSTFESLVRPEIHDAQGFEPVYVHRELLDAGVDDAADPAARQAGLERTCEIVREIAREGGQFRGLTLDSRLLSTRTMTERVAWVSEHPRETVWAWTTSWEGYRPDMELAGLLDQWRALAVRPC